MTVKTSTEISRQIALIKEEINSQREKHQGVLNQSVSVADLPKPYWPSVLTKHLTFNMVYKIVQNNMVFLEGAVRAQHASLGAKALDPTRTKSNEEIRKAALEVANSQTHLIEIGVAAHKVIDDADRQIATIDALFNSLANSLSSLSISVVGIVARYAI
ncbi:MAG TPA: hypothetical protein VLG44_00180 [Chlamydiales bacterium]|nr:hypothetical protein [Chlamydiales bacterium]